MAQLASEPARYSHSASLICHDHATKCHDQTLKWLDQSTICLPISTFGLGKSLIWDDQSLIGRGTSLIRDDHSFKGHGISLIGHGMAVPFYALELPGNDVHLQNNNSALALQKRCLLGMPKLLPKALLALYKVALTLCHANAKAIAIAIRGISPTVSETCLNSATKAIVASFP